MYNTTLYKLINAKEFRHLIYNLFMIIIGITGTLGADKGTVVEYLKTKYGFQHFSASAYIGEEVVRRGMEVDRDTLTQVANDLRASNHPAYIIEKLFKKAAMSGKNSIIESIRTVGEIELLRSKMMAISKTFIPRLIRLWRSIKSYNPLQTSPLLQWRGFQTNIAK
jgi:dephospho-CoA kinase